MKNFYFKGYTLIELVLFIAVMGLVAVAILIPLNVTNEKSPTPTYGSVSVLLAHQRMDLILGQRRYLGYANAVDPCPGPAVCTPPTGFTVSSSFTPTTISGDNGYKTITVTVTGPPSSQVLATLTGLIGNY